MNFQLYNDKVWTLPLQCQNAASVVQPFPSGSSPSAVSSNPASLNAEVALGTGGVGFKLILTPKVQASPSLTVTVTNVGMTPAVFVVDVVPDPNILSVAVDDIPADVTTAPQNVPVAPGP